MKNEDMTVGAALCMVVLCIIFGGNTVAIKYALTGLGPFTTAGTRFCVAGFCLFLWATYKKIPLGLTPKQTALIFIQGCLFSFQLSCFHVGLSRTTASHGTLIVNVVPFMVMILSHFFIPADRITLKKVFGIALGFTGVVLLFFDRPDLDADIHSGDLMVLGAVMCWSVSIVFLKRIIDGFNTIQVTLYPMVIGVPFFFVGAVIWDDPMVTSVTPLVVNALLFQALVTTCVGFVAWNAMMRRYGATAQYSFLFIVPLAGVFFGVWLLGEPVTRYLLGSVIFIVAGITVVNVKKRKKPGRF